MESERRSAPVVGQGLHLRMLGPLAIIRDNEARPLPASRKVRALIGYLTLAPHAVSRAHLCELLWEVPNDPRGELRWCLSKIRNLLDQPGRRRVETSGDTVRLALGDCSVDVVEIVRATQDGLGNLAPERLRELAAMFAGDFLDGLDVERSPQFGSWLIAQRRRFRGSRAAVLEHLVRSLSGRFDEGIEPVEEWLRLTPFDPRPHEVLLALLARRGRIADGEEHLAAASRLFEAEGLDCGFLREAWRAARGRSAPARPIGTPSVPERGLPAAGDPGVATIKRSRASIVVMPFVDRTGGGGAGDRQIEGLSHDIITRLAKLRNLFVIAQGSVFALAARNIGPPEAARILDVDFVASGWLHRRPDRIVVGVELAEARTARIIWTDDYDETLDGAFSVLDAIGSRIASSITSEIETAESSRAILKPPGTLDAWEAYHCGLWHMYRYNRTDNEQAQQFFRTALHLDPTFARAYAGLSFSHFQNAFQHWRPRERDREIGRAVDAAGKSLMSDDRDPAAHWAMGRALWLRGRQDESIAELEIAVALSPSFAHGHYTLSFVRSQSGDPGAAIVSTDHARLLSPFDPLLCAMLSTRAIALVRLGRFEEAADWAVRAIARPNAFPHIRAIAAFSLALADRLDEARAVEAAVHATFPDYRVDDLLSAFQFCPEAAALFRQGAGKVRG